jgi:hypothetical protein
VPTTSSELKAVMNTVSVFFSTVRNVRGENKIKETNLVGTSQGLQVHRLE